MKGNKATLGIVLLAFAGSASAQIANGSFEEPFLSSGYTQNGIDGWTTSGSSAGVWVMPASGFFTAPAPDGRQIGYFNGTSIAQQTGFIIEEGLQSLTIMAGRRSDGFAGSFRLELWAGGTVSAGNVNGGTLLGSALFDHTQVEPTSWHQLQIDYTAASGDAAIGQAVDVRLVRTAGSQADFDLVQFNGVVPEPGTVAAMGLGLFALVARRRKK